jgi:hypothetical protein
MPWGNYENPNCAGFTPEQMALLNWSQMDFSEYTDSLTIQEDPRKQAQKQSRSNEDPSNTLKVQSQALVDAMQSGTPVEIASPTRAHNRPIIITPREIQGPADVSLIAAPFWLETPLGQNRQEAVQSVQIDWGDGSKQSLESPNLGPDHAVTHHYGMAPKHNIETVITSVFTLKNGHLHVVKTDIKNYWDTPDMTTTNNGGPEFEDNQKRVLNVMPGYGQYDPNEVLPIPVPDYTHSSQP